MENNKWIEVYNNEHRQMFPTKNITGVVKDIETEDGYTYYTVTLLVFDGRLRSRYTWRDRSEAFADELYKEFISFVAGITRDGEIDNKPIYRSNHSYYIAEMILQ